MKYLFYTILFLSLISCGDTTDNNQTLPYKLVDFTVNLNLSEGINLNTNGGQDQFLNQGLKGVLIIRRSDTNFIAFEMACPHLDLQDCSRMTVGSLFMTCPCDEERFQLLDDGVAENGNISQNLRNYNVIRSGDILRITN
ncbi:MAG: Rieske 2Fe-2S domain-containing protein [Flavobacteriaceae bacterium]|nr:Rieske 2Fe-2S domain-containing protein [Flavobacteriaceae bacterium]